jgi:hypothetical protein
MGCGPLGCGLVDFHVTHGISCHIFTSFWFDMMLEYSYVVGDSRS